MALKNARAVLTTSLSTIYTCPSNTQARVLGCQVAATGGTAELDLQWTDDSASDAVTWLVEGVEIPDNTALAPIAGSLVLEAGDRLRGLASSSNRLHVSFSVDEE